jgi:ParB-like chromosome segregation protein Spo0J
MVRPVPLKDITIDEGVQARFKLDEKRVVLFAAIHSDSPKRTGQRLLPVTLIKTPDGTVILADGFTRVAAAKRAELGAIPANIRPGTKRDAILVSIEENARHGSPLTLEERRDAVERLLEDSEWRKLSDRELGRRCGLDNKTVSKLRCSTAPATAGERRTVRRAGKTYEISPVRKSRRARSDASLVATTSEEFPQMTDEIDRHGSRQKPQPQEPTALAYPAVSPAKEEQNIGDTTELSRQWGKLTEQVLTFVSLLHAANPEIRDQFLNEIPAASALIVHSELLRHLKGAAGATHSRDAGADA